MNGRLVVALAAMLAATGLAGCIETLSFLSSSDEVTARENRELADNAAAAWAPDAQLVSVFAFENANATDQFPSDPDVGNGRSVLWFYGYVAENGTQARAFQVSADGEVLAVNDSNEMDAQMLAKGKPMPIVAWGIDSDEAVQIARANETFESVAGMEGSSVLEALGSEDNMTVWAIMAGSEKGQALALVNAADGTLIMAESFKLDFDLPPMPGFPGRGGMGPQVEIQETGSLSDREEERFPFTIAYPDHAMLDLRFEKMLPTDGMEWAVLDAEGGVVAEGQVRSLMGMSDGTMEDFQIEEAGEYELVIRHASTTPLPLGGVEYDLTFVVGPPCMVTPKADQKGSVEVACASMTASGW